MSNYSIVKRREKRKFKSSLLLEFLKSQRTQSKIPVDLYVNVTTVYKKRKKYLLLQSIGKIIN